MYDFKKWFNKDVGGMLILIALFVLLGSIVGFLSGCAGSVLRAEVEHHSSTPDYHDRETADMLGVCLDMPMKPSRYSPSLEVCLHDEWKGKNVFGNEPTGTVRLKQPLWVKK